MLRAALTSCAVLILLAAAARGAPAPAMGQPPPELVALAKKMEAVQLSSERFSLRTLVSALATEAANAPPMTVPPGVVPVTSGPAAGALTYKQVFRFFHQRIVEVFIVECVKLSRLVISKRNVQTVSFLDPKLLPEVVSPGLPPVSNRWLVSIGPPAVDCQQ